MNRCNNCCFQPEALRNKLVGSPKLPIRAKVTAIPEMTQPANPTTLLPYGCLPKKVQKTITITKAATYDYDYEPVGQNPSEVECLAATHRVLLVVDDNDDSEAALAWVLKNLMLSPKHELRLLHVVSGQRMEAGYYHTSESLSGSASFSDKEDSQVHPLPRDALREEWAARTQSFLRRRFLDRLRGSGIRYEVDLVKEYGPDSGVAVGHCICDAAEGLGADTVVVPRGAGGGDFLSQFVAHYCTRPVVLLSGRQLRRGPAAAAAPDCAVDALHPAPKGRVLLFALDSSMSASWAVDWAMDAMYRPGDELHLVHVGLDADRRIKRNLDAISHRLQSRGVVAAGHVIGQSGGEAQQECDRVKGALSELALQLGAQALFLVSHSDGLLKDFLGHTIAGRCVTLGRCTTVLLHQRRPEGPADHTMPPGGAFAMNGQALPAA